MFEESESDPAPKPESVIGKWLAPGAYLLIGGLIVGYAFVRYRQGCPPEASLLSVRGQPQRVRWNETRGRYGSKFQNVQFAVGEIDTSYESDQPRFEDVERVLRSAQIVEIWVCKTGAANKLYKLNSNRGRPVVTYSDSVGKNTQDLFSILFIGGASLVLGTYFAFRRLYA